jgi:hypothetical protein
MANHCLKPILGLWGVLAAFGMLAPAHGYADTGPGGPFLGSSGQWSGVGIVTRPDGSTERLGCTSANAVNANGWAIAQNLRCASDRFRLDITSNAVSAGGWLSGMWDDSTHGVRGNLSGRVSRSAILAHIAGNGFAARMIVRAQGKRQLVTMRTFTLRPRNGTKIASVSVALHK